MSTTTELARMCFFLLELSVDHFGSHVTFVVVVVVVVARRRRRRRRRRLLSCLVEI